MSAHQSPATRPFYWSVRREIWENRSILIAPAAAACIILLALLLGAGHLSSRMQAAAAMDPVQRAGKVATPYEITAFIVLVTVFIVGVFYCLDALHGERRDRSLLFWKSLPVSDLTAVLAKAAIPLLVLPAVALVVTLCTQVAMLLLSTAILLMAGSGTAILWQNLPLLRLSLTLLYGLVTLALWHAPIYGWLLVVSAWARRTVFLWAMLPPLAICVVEKIAFDSSYFAHMVYVRLSGSFAAAFGPQPADSIIDPPDPIRFLATPGLWIGLAAFACFIVAAVWLRRTREPV